MIIKEIFNVQPYHFKVDGDGYSFIDKAGNRIGVIFEELDVQLPDRTLSLVNVSFGALKPEQKNAHENLDQSLTNAGDLRRVFSTVGEITTQSKVARECDLLVMAGADEHAQRRAEIYLIAFLDLRDKMPRFKKASKIKLENGSIMIVAQSVRVNTRRDPVSQDTT